MHQVSLIYLLIVKLWPDDLDKQIIEDYIEQLEIYETIELHDIVLSSLFLLSMTDDIIKRYESRYKGFKIESLFERKTTNNNDEVNKKVIERKRKIAGKCYICNNGKCEVECSDKKCNRKAHLFCAFIEKAESDWLCENCNKA